MAHHNHFFVEDKIAVRLNSDLCHHTQNRKQRATAHQSHSRR